MNTLRLTKATLVQYLKPKYSIFLPSWKSLRDKADLLVNQKKSGCGKCGKSYGIYWREFLSWYNDNPKAIDELKKMTQMDNVEFWNNLIKPIKRIIL